MSATARFARLRANSLAIYPRVGTQKDGDKKKAPRVTGTPLNQRRCLRSKKTKQES